MRDQDLQPGNRQGTGKLLDPWVFGTEHGHTVNKDHRPGCISERQILINRVPIANYPGRIFHPPGAPALEPDQ